MPSLGIEFPFRETDQGGVFKGTKTSRETVKSNLIAFMTLRKGQRPMNNALYSPLYDYLFEQWDDIAETELYNTLQSKVQRFFPEIDLEEIKLTFIEEEVRLRVEMAYSLPELGGVTDNIQLEFDVEN